MKKHNAVTISLIAVLLGLLIASLVLLISGINPLQMFYALIRSLTGFYILKPEQGINPSYPLNWLLNSLPIILTGCSVGFAYRTGMFNIGGEGQFIAGAFAATAVATLVDLPPFIHVICCILAAAVAGALWGFLPGFLKATRNINEVVICVMLNYIALYLNQWAVKSFLPIDLNTKARTINFPNSATFTPLNFGTTSQFHWGFIIVVLCLVFYWFIMEKTTFGYSIKATGFNKEGARYAGMKTKLNCTASFMIAGAFSGLAGAIVTIGVFKYGRIVTAFDGYGFDGISVALVGSGNAIGIFLAGLLFGLLKAAGTTFQLLGIPKEVASIIQACVLIFVAIQYGIKLVLSYFEKRKEKKVDGCSNS